jgi:hypothetical protein
LQALLLLLLLLLVAQVQVASPRICPCQFL